MNIWRVKLPGEFIVRTLSVLYESDKVVRLGTTSVGVLYEDVIHFSPVTYKKEDVEFIEKVHTLEEEEDIHDK